ncbi:MULTISPECIES: ATP-binding protein [unclassified Leifsonia]|uniref:sensor histidine kinase n=1 Tax=unclassified Leifsonia TaxID=2663824 RepID=UPI0008A7C398|nr:MULTISPECIES: ATP-binding protein [unclassified Leifsonia]SEH75618.1 PAS domain S-box-containing protein [Leifsonia sp. CL154]SFL37089.1 PAS domain S-box-containing protein [Leifsonia sp. CL147]
MTLDRWLSRIPIDSPSPFMKQLPTIVGFAIAVLIALVPNEIPVDSGLLFAIGSAVVVVASIFSFVIPWSRFHPQWAVLVPILSLLAIGLLRIATGGSSSPFGVLILLPFVWIASEEGRTNILLAVLMILIVLVAPLLFSGLANSGADIVRAFFAPVIYCLVAIVINEIAHRMRTQLAAARESNEKQETLLSQAVTAQDELVLKEARLKTANRLIQSIWNAVTEQSVIGTDLDGLIDVWNPGAEKMLGLTEKQVLDGHHHVTEFHLPSELAQRIEDMDARFTTVASSDEFSALVDTVRAGSADVRDWTYVRPDGKQVAVQVAATPRLDENGHRVGFIFVATDMTQAREFARLKDEFVGLISHELRTPLSSILGYLELMRDDEDAPLSEEQLQYLSVAERNAHRLLRLVGDLLFTAQVESGRFPLEIKDVELDSVVSASIESARPIARNAGVTLVSDVPEQRLDVRGDPVRLGQAVDNLVSNALKFTPAGGTVTVSLRPDGPQAVIAVTDTGIGIPAVELGRLSQRFFRASTATRNAVPGVGLGLTITKAIVTAHGGRLDIASEEGVGTSISIVLPVETPQPVTEALPQAELAP